MERQEKISKSWLLVAACLIAISALGTSTSATYDELSEKMGASGSYCSQLVGAANDVRAISRDHAVKRAPSTTKPSATSTRSPLPHSIGPGCPFSLQFLVDVSRPRRVSRLLTQTEIEREFLANSGQFQERRQNSEFCVSLKRVASEARNTSFLAKNVNFS